MRKIIKECKNLSKTLINQTPTIMPDSGWYFDFDKEHLGIVVSKEMSLEGEITKKIFDKITKSNFSLFTYSILHELGHFYNYLIKPYSSEDILEEQQDSVLLNQLCEEGLLSFEQSLLFYYAQPTEKQANKFVKNVIKKNFELIKNFDKKINELMEEN